MSARITSNWDFSGSGAISGICVHFGFVSMPSFSRLIMLLSLCRRATICSTEHILWTQVKQTCVQRWSRNHPSDTWSILGKPLDGFVFIFLPNSCHSDAHYVDLASVFHMWNSKKATTKKMRNKTKTLQYARRALNATALPKLNFLPQLDSMEFLEPKTTKRWTTISYVCKERASVENARNFRTFSFLQRKIHRAIAQQQWNTTMT